MWAAAVRAEDCEALLAGSERMACVGGHGAVCAHVQKGAESSKRHQCDAAGANGAWEVWARPLKARTVHVAGAGRMKSVLYSGLYRRRSWRRGGHR